MTKAQQLYNVLALALCSATPVAAQTGLGHLEDASTPPRGLLRMRAAAVWTRYDARFTPTGHEPLGAFLTADSLGPAQIPSLIPLEQQVESAAGAPFLLSLGRSRLSATGREEIVPITFEYGITSRLAVTALLPVIRKRVAVQWQVDTTGGFVATVGPNPHRAGGGAAVVNGQLQSQFLSAQTLLSQRLAQCAANAAQPQCGSVNGREALANALLLESQRFANDIAAIYGTASTDGSAFVPMSGTSAQALIEGRVGTFNSRFQDFLGSPSNFVTATPVAAAGPAGITELQRYFVNELGRDSIAFQEKVWVGDWELGAKYRAIDRPTSETRRLGVQLAVAGALRFPSGSRHSESEIVDLHTGSGAMVLATRGILDAKYARLGLLVATDLAFALQGVDSIAGLPADSRWTELHVAPRWHLSVPFAIHGAYSLRSANESGGDQLAGVGFSFTTIDRWTGGRLPIEMRYTHLEAISGDAGRPRFFRDQVELRLYYRLLKR